MGRHRGRRGLARPLVTASGLLLAGVLAVVGLGEPGAPWAIADTGHVSTSPSAVTVPAAATSSPATVASATPTPSAAATAATTPAAGTAAATSCAGQSAATVRARTARLTLPVAVIAGSAADTDRLPMAIAPRGGKGSWLAWVGVDSRVHLVALDCRDRIVGASRTFTGIDLQDVSANASGGVLLLTRKGSCHTGPLCGGASSPCNTMWMVRFDSQGRQVWQRQVTNLTATRGGYTPGARFVWWYQHHGRLASDGTNTAAYFATAITVRNGSCVDIHEGDSLQVVNARGQLVSGHQSFAVGCSHSWTTRILWDPRKHVFVPICATDGGCRIARPTTGATVAQGRCDGTLFGGDIALASTSGYWTAWSQGGTVRLNRFGAGKDDRAITAAARSAHPHLVAFGTRQLLLTWQAGRATRAQVLSAATGRPIAAAFTVTVPDEPYQAWKAYPDGSAAFASGGTGGRSVTIAHVLPAT